MNSTRKRLKEIEEVWERLTLVHKIYFIVVLVWKAYSITWLFNAIIAAIVGGLLFDIFVVSSPVSLVVSALILHYWLFFGYFIPRMQRTVSKTD